MVSWTEKIIPPCPLSCPLFVSCLHGPLYRFGCQSCSTWSADQRKIFPLCPALPSILPYPFLVPVFTGLCIGSAVSTPSRSYTPTQHLSPRNFTIFPLKILMIPPYFTYGWHQEDRHAPFEESFQVSSTSNRVPIEGIHYHPGLRISFRQ